jgi:hypothetical protein
MGIGKSMPSSYLILWFPFFLSARRTMKVSVRNWTLLLLVAAVCIGFAYLFAPVTPLEAKIASDVAKVNSRFTPDESIDVAMAMKMVTHEPPQMLNPPSPPQGLLLYPPSDADLERLSGP